MQSTLDLLETLPLPKIAIWEHLSKPERAAVMAPLAGMILAAALGVSPDQVAANQPAKENHDG